jgi:CspA family cold shock protein
VVQLDQGLWLIKPNGGGPDVLKKGGHTGLAESAQVSYELVTGRAGKTSAENLGIG